MMNAVLTSQSAHAKSADPVPLCVGMNGTLIRTNALVEGVVRLLRANLLNILPMLLWLCRGRACFKHRVASRMPLDLHSLPHNEAVLAWLRQQHAEGRRLILCTGANQDLAEQMAAHYGIFSRVLASSESSNRSGEDKADSLIREYGCGGFDYAGHDARDLPVWHAARRAVLVSATPALRQRLDAMLVLEKEFQGKDRGVRTWVRACRLHQWAKNVLIFLPAVGAHQLLDPGTLLASVTAFVLFGVCASGTYLLNDLMDLEADRGHPSKQHRPLASGELPVDQGLMAAGLMITASLGLALLALGPLFLAMMLVYLLSTVLYSSIIKRIAMVDVLTLAGLYTVRVLGGSAATGIVPSFWLLAFSMFMFLSLAMAKRYAELLVMQDAGRRASSGRGYTVEDLPLIQNCGISTGYLSVLVFALYINSRPSEMFSYPEMLWLLCPLLLYWISRIWIKTHRRRMHEDPVVFALRDRPSLCTALLAGMLMLLAI